MKWSISCNIARKTFNTRQFSFTSLCPSLKSSFWTFSNHNLINHTGLLSGAALLSYVYDCPFIRCENIISGMYCFINLSTKKQKSLDNFNKGLYFFSTFSSLRIFFLELLTNIKNNLWFWVSHPNSIFHFIFASHFHKLLAWLSKFS